MKIKKLSTIIKALQAAIPELEAARSS